MSKHRTKPPSHAAPPNAAPRRRPTPVVETLDEQTDVLSFGAHEHTEIQHNLGELAALRSPQSRPASPQPSSSLFEDDEHTQINPQLDVSAARARRRVEAQPPSPHAHPPQRKLNPQPTPVRQGPHAPPSPNTFDADEKTEFGLDLDHIEARPTGPEPQHAPPRARFATTAAQAVSRPTRQSGAHPLITPPQATGPHANPSAPQPRQSGFHPPAHWHTGALPHVAQARPVQPSAQHASLRGVAPTQRPSHSARPHTTAGFPTVQPAPHTSGAYPAIPHTPHVSGAYPVASPVSEERTSPALETIPASGALPSPEGQAVVQPKLGYVDLGLNSPLVAPNVRRQVEFLKEETGVDFDPMAMSSPNLNALVLALGAHDAELQETAAALVHNVSDEVIALRMKWGDAQSEPSARMRMHYGMWGALAGALFGAGLMALLALATSRPLSSFGVMSVLWPALCALGVLSVCAWTPRRVEGLLFRSKLLPASSAHSPRT